MFTLIVYYFQQGINADTKPIVIESRMMKKTECKQLDCTNARFGAALTNIGDIDLDGFQGKCSCILAVFLSTGSGDMVTLPMKSVSLVDEYSSKLFRKMFTLRLFPDAFVDCTAWSDAFIFPVSINTWWMQINNNRHIVESMLCILQI